jgi:hypothetical protein
MLGPRRVAGGLTGGMVARAGVGWRVDQDVPAGAGGRVVATTDTRELRHRLLPGRPVSVSRARVVAAQESSSMSTSLSICGPTMVPTTPASNGDSAGLPPVPPVGLEPTL